MVEKPQSGILAFLKKIGLPGIIAGIVSALVTMVPILFQIDERYAKADDMAVISKQLTELTVEVGRLAGTQQVMVAIMSAKPEVRFSPVPRRLNEISTVEAPTILPTTIPKTTEERNTSLEAVTKSLEYIQAKVQSIQQ